MYYATILLHQLYYATILLHQAPVKMTSVLVLFVIFTGLA